MATTGARCTGALKYWDLQPIAALPRETAIFVNLRSTTRGLNRWLALQQVLELLQDRVEVRDRGFVVPEASELRRFIESPYPLSDAGIAALARENPSAEIDRAIRWSPAPRCRCREQVPTALGVVRPLQVAKVPTAGSRR